MLGLRFRVKRLGSQFGEGVRKLVFPSPTCFLPLPLGGGGVRRGWDIHFEHLIIWKFEFVSKFEFRISDFSLFLVF